ncbi:MAG TPA: lysine N(6)-hydroxylase/L-ornithine N(5)-oxygenase family protein [Nocardioidaceae bacterium]|nr:lysine N(6)-hydroxylase/L-ornithine N(5)-oxygenase family protein [Nocardioidaceae bacterium]
MTTPTYDLVGIGIGPFNLALAALADEVADLDVLFLDDKPEFSWHPGMLLDGTTLQVPFLADLVTLVDPTNRWSFLSYLRAHDRLFPFYFFERFEVPRREYDHYCRWVAASLASCRFGSRVQRVDPYGDLFMVTYADQATGRRAVVAARNVVLGIGTAPATPSAFDGLLGKQVLHSADYRHHAGALADAGDVTVIGSGQSGAEVFLDQLKQQPDTGARLRWLTRSPAFAPMEYSKLGLEHFTPDYTRYVRGLPPDTRDTLFPAQWQLYKAISADTIAQIYDLLYERSVAAPRPPVTLTPNVAVVAAEHHDDRLRLTCRETLQERESAVDTDAVVLATGYRPRPPAVLDPVRPLLETDEAGRPRVDGDYRVATGPEVSAGLYVQNAEQHTHGVGTPDLGLGAWRAATILNSVADRTVHPLPDRTAFTTFGVA